MYGILHRPSQSKEKRIFIRPHVLLQPYIAHYTLYYPDVNDAQFLQVIPDGSGCIVMEFNEKRAESHFLGASTRTVTVNNAGTPPHFFVEFRPGGAGRLFPFPPEELRDSRIQLGACSGEVEKQMLEIIESQNSLWGLAERMDELFLRQLERQEVLHPITEAILSGGRLLTIHELEAEFHYSQRHIRRIVLSQLGISLKTFTDIIRINQIINKVSEGNTRLLEIAIEHEYYDQAHFNHQFKKMCGVSPASYIQNKAVFYNDSLKF